MLKIKFINNVSEYTKKIIIRKTGDPSVIPVSESEYNAVGICQGDLADILYAADIAEKAATVKVGEIQGTCPNHIACIGIWGDTSSVKTALTEIRKEFPEIKR